MAGYGMSSGKSYGSGGVTVIGKRRLNKTNNERAGKAFVKVRRADGTVGHKYGSHTVWLKPKKAISGP